MSPVTRTSACLAGASLAIGLLAGPAASATADYGRTRAPDGTLRNGCHNYRYGYGYRITPPTDDWTLETFLRDPTGEGLASDTFIAESDARKNRTHFRLCRYSTRPGRFTIRALMHWYGATGEEYAVWLDPSHFRLSRPR